MTQKDARYDVIGPIILMAWVDNYCMVRRPHRTLFVLREKEWYALSIKPVTLATSGES